MHTCFRYITCLGSSRYHAWHHVGISGYRVYHHIGISLECPIQELVMQEDGKAQLHYGGLILKKKLN